MKTFSRQLILLVAVIVALVSTATFASEPSGLGTYIWTGIVDDDGKPVSGENTDWVKIVLASNFTAYVYKVDIEEAKLEGEFKYAPDPAQYFRELEVKFKERGLFDDRAAKTFAYFSGAGFEDGFMIFGSGIPAMTLFRKGDKLVSLLPTIHGRQGEHLVFTKVR